MDQSPSQEKEDEKAPKVTSEESEAHGAVHDQRQTQHQDAKDLRAWRRWTALEKTQTILTFALCLTTALYTYFSYQQWQMMRASLTVSQRAYVGVHSLQMDLSSGQVLVMLENMGKVPAQDIKVSAHTSQEAEGKIRTSAHPTFEAGHTQLFPGTFKIQVPIPLKDFTPQEASNILTGRTTLYVAGKIQYGDGFGNPQTSDFAFRYVPPPHEGWTAIPIVTFAELQQTPPQKEGKGNEQ
ncbi:hypothetical protein EPO44_09625 [bacterium]|nr:MAG: hypothetical protein EPO44_09625 [bacterium]